MDFEHRFGPIPHHPSSARTQLQMSIDKEQEMTAATVPTGMTKIIPSLSWLSSYESGWLRFDLVAGLTAAAVVIPQVTAYDQVLIMSGPLTSGLTSCGTPAGIMEQEQAFLSLMQSAASFQISAGQLSIFDGGGNRILILVTR